MLRKQNIVSIRQVRYFEQKYKIWYQNNSGIIQNIINVTGDSEFVNYIELQILHVARREDIQLHQRPYTIEVSSHLAAVVEQSVIAFAPRVGGWVFESQTPQIQVVKQVVAAPLLSAQ